METGQMDELIFELERRFLECSICTEIFDDKKLVPRYLPCQHTFCSNCLIKLCRKNEIKCPSCNAVHELPKHGINGFPKDNTRRDLRYFLQNKSECLPVLCALCKKHSKCFFNCLLCEQILCERCKTDHIATNPYHVTVKSKAADDSGNYNRCKNPRHKNEQLRFFCTSCNISICDLCKLNEHSDTKNHQTEDIILAVENQKLCLRASTILLEQKILKLKHQEVKIKDNKENLRRHRLEYNIKLENLYDRGTRILKRQKDTLLKKYSQLHNSLENDFAGQERKVEDYLANAEYCCKSSLQLIDGNNIGFFLAVNKTIYSHIQNFLNESFEMVEKDVDMELKSVDENIFMAEESLQQVSKISEGLLTKTQLKETPKPAPIHIVTRIKNYVARIRPLTSCYQLINMFRNGFLKSTGKVINQIQASRRKLASINERINAIPVLNGVYDLLKLMIVFHCLVWPFETMLKEYVFTEGRFNTRTNSHFACRSEDNKTVANVPKFGMICGTRNRPFKYEGVFANSTLKPGDRLVFFTEFKKISPKRLPKGTIIFEFGLVMESVNSVYLFGNNIFSISGYICNNKVGVCLKNRNGYNIDSQGVFTFVDKSNLSKGRFVIQSNSEDGTVEVLSGAKSKNVIDVYKNVSLDQHLKPVFAIYSSEEIQISITLKSKGSFEFDSTTLHSNNFISADNKTFSNKVLPTVDNITASGIPYIYASNMMGRNRQPYIRTVMNIDFNEYDKRQTNEDLFIIGFGYHKNGDFIPVVQIRCFVCSVTYYQFYTTKGYCVSDVLKRHPYTVVGTPLRILIQYDTIKGTLSLFIKSRLPWDISQSFLYESNYSYFPKLYLQNMHAKEIVAWWSRDVTFIEAVGSLAKKFT